MSNSCQDLEEAFDELDKAAWAVVDWWSPANAKTRNFLHWFDTVLPDLREALGLPRSMADEPSLTDNESGAS